MRLTHGSTLKSCVVVFSIFALCPFLFANCGSSTSTGSSASGRISAGPVSGATVTVYPLNSNGSQGAALCSAQTAADGSYTLGCTSSTPVEIVASGATASWPEEATGTTQTLGQAVLRVVLPSLSTGQQVGVTPLTEMATQRVIALLSTSANTSAPLASTISAVNSTVSTMFGLSDITQAPPDMTKAAPSDAKAAAHGLVLAALSQLSTNYGGGNSLNLMQALADKFAYDGKLDSGTVGGSVQVPIPGGSGNLSTILNSPTALQTQMQAAMNTYQGTKGAALGYTAGAVPQPTMTPAPPAPTGVSFTNPTAPASFPSTPPTQGGVQMPNPSPSTSPTPAPVH